MCHISHHPKPPPPTYPLHSATTGALQLHHHPKFIFTVPITHRSSENYCRHSPLFMCCHLHSPPASKGDRCWHQQACAGHHHLAHCFSVATKTTSPLRNFCSNHRTVIHHQPEPCSLPGPPKNLLKGDVSVTALCRFITRHVHSTKTHALLHQIVVVHHAARPQLKSINSAQLRPNPTSAPPQTLQNFVEPMASPTAPFTVSRHHVAPILCVCSPARPPHRSLKSSAAVCAVLAMLCQLWFISLASTLTLIGLPQHLQLKV